MSTTSEDYMTITMQYHQEEDRPWVWLIRHADRTVVSGDNRTFKGAADAIGGLIYAQGHRESPLMENAQSNERDARRFFCSAIILLGSLAGGFAVMIYLWLTR